MWLRANVFHIVLDIYTRLSVMLQLTSYRAEYAHVFSVRLNDDHSWTVAGCRDTLAAVHVGVLYSPFVRHL